MYGYVYMTINTINGKVYIGKHKSDTYDPNYLGSGKVLKIAIEKYGKENFFNFILNTADTLEELNEEEQICIKELQTQDNQLGYNLAFGGDGGGGMSGHIHTAETKEKIKESSIKTKNTPEYKEKFSQIAKEMWVNMTDEKREQFKQKCKEIQTGKPHSEESKRKVSETLKNGYAESKYKSQKGKTAWNKGKTVSKEQKEKLQLMVKGRIHITNGEINKMIYPEEYEKWEEKGFKKGRTIHKLKEEK